MQSVFEKIIEKLELESDHASDKIAEQNVTEDMCYYDGFEDGVDKAIEIVKQTEYNNGWIPCSERLPENDNDVLVTYLGYFDDKPDCTDLAYFDNEEQEWRWQDGDEVNVKITAWQQLPEPYKPEMSKKFE